jgi:ubiquinone/menaquinone biosynthesis C-methylase UbiE
MLGKLMPVSDKSHWDQVYTGRANDTWSWVQQVPALSLALIEACGVDSDAAIIDVGGGTAPLSGELIRRGYSDLWLLDISGAALKKARHRLGADAARIHWLESDVTQVELPLAYFDIWHDRAVFHFLTEASARAAYVGRASAAVKPGGHLVVATFAEDGPTHCSGLPVLRYDTESLQVVFGDAFSLVQTAVEAHRTPMGGLQSFRYALFRRADS